MAAAAGAGAGSGPCADSVVVARAKDPVGPWPAEEKTTLACPFGAAPSAPPLSAASRAASVVAPADVSVRRARARSVPGVAT